MYRSHRGPLHLARRPYTLHLTPYTPHPTPYTLHPAPYTNTPNPTPYILHPKPYTINAKLYALNPTPRHQIGGRWLWPNDDALVCNRGIGGSGHGPYGLLN